MTGRLPLKSTVERALVADCGGLITDLGIALPTALLSEGRADGSCEGSDLLVPVSNLLVSLPPDMHLHIFVDRVACDKAKLWLSHQTIRCELSLVPVGSDIGAVKSLWIQDQIHVRTVRTADREWTELLSRPYDRLGAAIACHLALECVADGLALPGGNQLIGQEFRLVGSSQLNLKKLGSQSWRDGSDRWREISALDGRSVSLFGYRAADFGPEQGESAGLSWDVCRDRIHQCGFHVDQFVSVTGLSIDGRPLLLVADPISLDPGGERGERMLKRQLDASVRLLEQQGFAVERNPVPLAVVPDTGKRLPRLYNNVLVENGLRTGRSQAQVWVPQFGDMEPLQEFDRRNLAVWRELGFAPIPVAGWSNLCSRNGAIRCVTKVLRRNTLSSEQVA